MGAQQLAELLRAPARTTATSAPSCSGCSTQGVATRRGIMCSHREPVHTRRGASAGCRQSEAAQDRCIILPLYPQMTDEEQARVAEALARACGLP